MDRATIRTAFTKYKTDKALHRYDQMYTDIFSDLTPTKMLEIGIYTGKSMAAWKELFPQAEVYGMDKRIFPLIEDANQFKSNIVYADSALLQSQDLVPTDFEIIIDDGDHRPNVQWATFMNFRQSWSRYYVIEDIITEENEKLMRKRLKDNGFRDVTTYTSAFQGNVIIHGVDAPRTFFAIVVKK